MPRNDGKNGSVTVPAPLLEEINATATADAKEQKLLRPDSASRMVEIAWRFYLAHRDEFKVKIEQGENVA